MPKDINKRRKQDLGIFYTPQEVVDFIFDILNIWKNKEDKEIHRWQTRKPKPHFPSVIDPACGEGIFLKTAVTSGFTGYHPIEKTPYVFGVDIDGEVVKRWEEISILHDLFKGKKNKMLDHFHQQDGLLELPDKVFNYKTGGLKEFDAVVGNPPYGGMGFSSLKEKSTSESIQILEHLKKFEILSYRKRKNGSEISQSPLWGEALWGTIPWGRGNHIPTNKEVESIAIEILFIDRFIQLAKPGGWIAVIIPDGILTNSNSHYVREFISNRAKVKSIVSLPRETFKNAGTSAKTSILFLRKLKKEEKPESSYPVFLASSEKIEEDLFNEIVISYEKFYNLSKAKISSSAYNLEGNRMNKSNFIQTIKDQNKREVVMVRVDKTLKELTEEKPQSRWDVKYWHPKYDDIITILKTGRYPLKAVGEYIKLITYGSTKPRDYSQVQGEGVKYIRSVNVLFTGLNESEIHWIKEGGRLDGAQYKVNFEDIVMNKCGTGTSGRSFCYLKRDKIVVSQHTMLIRLKGIDPSYFVVFMDSIYGASQFEKFDKGTSGQTHIDFEDIKSIKIPLLLDEIQKSIRSEYETLNNYHYKAMDAKIKGEEKEYKENLENAERRLKDLIKRTEEVIEGKREDVN